jgi:hypothetical protein
MMENKNTDQPSDFSSDVLTVMKDLKERLAKKIEEAEHQKEAPKLYIARFQDNTLHLIYAESLPSRDCTFSTGCGKFRAYGKSYIIDLPSELFPEITWKNSPMVLRLEKPHIY